MVCSSSIERRTTRGPRTTEITFFGLFLHYSTFVIISIPRKTLLEGRIDEKTRTEEHRRTKLDLKWMISLHFRGQPMPRSCCHSTSVIKYCMFDDLKLQPRVPVAMTAVAWLQCKRCKIFGRIMPRTWASTGRLRTQGPVRIRYNSLLHQY